MIIIIPGVSAPEGSPQLDRSLARPGNTPMGPVSTLLDRLTGSYDAFDLAVIQHVYSSLEESGTLARCDSLSFCMKNAADSLINWTGKADSVNNGAAFGTSLGFTFNGVSSWIDPAAQEDGLGQYQLNQASAAVYITDPGPVQAVKTAIGRAGGGLRTALFIYQATTGVAFRVNALSSSQLGGSLVGPRTGLFQALRLDANRQLLVRGTDILIDDAASPVDSLPNSQLALGREDSVTYSAFSTGGWYFGNYMPLTHRAKLTEAFKVMTTHFLG